VLYGKTQEQLTVWEWVSDVLSKPSESRGKPEASVETPEVEKELLSTIEAWQGINKLESYTEHLGTTYIRYFIWVLDTLK
jgi:hypothetical protein